MRVKRGIVAHRKHKKLLASTKGYRMTKHRLVRVAKEAQLHAGQYAFAGRRLKKRDMRRLWITRISNNIKQYGLSYSRFMDALKKQNIALDRKSLSIMIQRDQEAFKALVDRVKNA